MLGNFLKLWGRDEKASTAIEFSLLSIPYVFLTLAIFEIAIMFASASLLEAATNSASRMIKTGQLQQTQGGDPQDTFRQAICDYASALIKCDDIVTEVMPMNSFSDYASLEAQYDEDGNMVSQGFDAGGSDDRILIRVAYRYTMLTPLIGPLLVGPSNSRLFMSTVVLQTEPYEF